MLFVLDLLGTFVFVLSGAFKGRKYELDWLGVTVLAMLTGVSGGVIRNVWSANCRPYSPRGSTRRRPFSAGLSSSDWMLAVFQNLSPSVRLLLPDPPSVSTPSSRTSTSRRRNIYRIRGGRQLAGAETEYVIGSSSR